MRRERAGAEGGSGGACRRSSCAAPALVCALVSLVNGSIELKHVSAAAFHALLTYLVVSLSGKGREGGREG